MTRREIGQRYRGSYLGLLWAVLTPLAMLLVYTFVFTVIFPARWSTATELQPLEVALIIFSGLAAFNLFSEALNRAPGLILSYPNYVKKVVFPLEILPVVVVGAALFTSLISVALILLGSVMFLGRISPTVVFLPLAYVPLLLLTLGLTWFLAGLGVYLRDIGQAIAVLVQMFLFLSPVFFSPLSVPEWIRPIYEINPLVPILDMFRATLVFGKLPSAGSWLVSTIITAFVGWLGYIWFLRVKRGFADVL